MKSLVSIPEVFSRRLRTVQSNIKHQTAISAASRPKHRTQVIATLSITSIAVVSRPRRFAGSRKATEAYSFLLKVRLSQLFLFSGGGLAVEGRSPRGGAATGDSPVVFPRGIGLRSPPGLCTGPPYPLGGAYAPSSGIGPLE